MAIEIPVFLTLTATALLVKSSRNVYHKANTKYKKYKISRQKRIAREKLLKEGKSLVESDVSDIESSVPSLTKRQKVKKSIKNLFFYDNINLATEKQGKDELVTVLYDQLPLCARSSMLLYCQGKSMTSELGGYTLDQRLLNKNSEFLDDAHIQLVVEEREKACIDRDRKAYMKGPITKEKLLNDFRSCWAYDRFSTREYLRHAETLATFDPLDSDSTESYTWINEYGVPEPCLVPPNTPIQDSSESETFVESSNSTLCLEKVMVSESNSSICTNSAMNSDVSWSDLESIKSKYPTILYQLPNGHIFEDSDDDSFKSASEGLDISFGETFQKKDTELTQTLKEFFKQYRIPEIIVPKDDCGKPCNRHAIYISNAESENEYSNEFETELEGDASSGVGIESDYSEFLYLYQTLN